MSVPMLFGLLMLAVLYIIYLLLIKGYLWKLILGIAGWFAIWKFLSSSYDWANNTGLSIDNNLISWAIIIPSIILFMAMSYTKE